MTWLILPTTHCTSRPLMALDVFQVVMWSVTQENFVALPFTLIIVSVVGPSTLNVVALLVYHVVVCYSNFSIIILLLFVLFWVYHRLSQGK